MSQLSKTKVPMAYIVLFFFALATMNVINRYYYFAYIAVGLFCIKQNRRFKLDAGPVAMLFLLAASWVLFSPESTASIFGLIKPFTYLLCYIVGNSLLDDDINYGKDKTPLKLFYITVTAVATGSLAHYLLNWVTNRNYGSRNTIDIWVGTEMAATGQAALACLPLGLAIACLFIKTGKKIKIASIAAILLILGYNLVLSGRTLLIMFAVIVLVALFHKLSTLKEGRARLIALFIAIILLIVFVYQTNLFNVRSYIEGSPLYDRFFSDKSDEDVEDDERLDRKIYYLKNFDRHLFGGAHLLEEIGYSHDIILDTHDEGGIFAFVGMLGYLFISLGHLVRCLKDKSLSFEFRNIVLCVYVIVYLEFMVEPILQGMPWLFATFCLIDGYVARVVKHNKMIQSKVR